MFNPISCGKCIAKLGYRIQGYDPRVMVKACVWQCIKKGRGGKSFRSCLDKKIRNTLHDVSHPEKVADEIWEEIKRKCSG